MAHTPGPPPAARPRPVLGGPAAWAILTVGQFAAVVAVLQRASLGVAATDALTRFGITAATLATFSMLQLLVYAALQVPVGVLIDRYGSKRLIVIGSLVMACAQAMFAVAASLPLAFAARVVLGVGDALTFISVMRLVPAWFPPERSARITTATGPVNQLGFVASAIGFASVLATAGWTPSFLFAALVSVGTAVLALALMRDSPLGKPPRVPLGRALTVAVEGVRGAWAEPGTRLGFWLGFMTLFTGMTFGVMWGYPFLTVGQGLSPGAAGTLMLVLSLSGLFYGVTLGSVLARYPYYRSLIAIGVVGVAMAAWAAVLLWPGPAPMWLLVTLVALIPATSILAVMTFDIARTSNPPRRLGSAIGVINGGAFVGTHTAVMAIGLVRTRPAHPGRRAGLLARCVQVGIRDPVRPVGARHRADAPIGGRSGGSPSATPRRTRRYVAASTCRRRRDLAPTEEHDFGERGGDVAVIEEYAADGVYDTPSYAQAVKVTGAQTILFISGQVAYDEKGNPAHGRDFAAQARAVFGALRAQVEAGGATLDDIVKLNTYLTDIRYREELARIREEFFGPRTRAATQVAVAALGRPEWLIEVEAIAVL